MHKTIFLRPALALCLPGIFALAATFSASSLVHAERQKQQANFVAKEYALRQQLGQLQDQLIELTERNKSHRRLLVLAGVFSSEDLMARASNP